MAMLHLLRHAKSDRDQPALGDHERPLNPRGRKAAKAMGRYLARTEFPLGLILCSAARRTRETLDLLQDEWKCGARVRIEERLYLASAGQLLRRLREVPEETGEVLVIAHNPGIHELAVQLSAAKPSAARDRLHHKYPTGALASFRIDAPWQDFGVEDAELLDFVIPLDLED